MPSERLARLEAQCEHTNAMVREMHGHLVGEPGKDGLVSRTAKLEQRSKLHSGIFSTIGLAIVGVLTYLFKTKA